MRPNVESNELKLYECFDCGARTRSTDGRECPECGGELKNLGLSRDL